jgi:hypothetical protein
MHQHLIKIILPAIIFLLWLHIPPGLAQDFTSENPPDLAELNKFRIEFMLLPGFGFENKTIGTYESGKPIEFSFGGGAGMALGLGYKISSRLEMNLAIGYQSTPYYGEKEDYLEGGFNRVIFTVTPKFRLKLSRRGDLKAGAGLGWFGNPRWVYKKSFSFFWITELVFDEYIFKYDSRWGFLGTLEYEHYLAGWISLSAGLKYYNVSYRLQSISRDDEPVPVSTFSTDFQQEFGKVDGSGIDIIISVSVHL